MRVLVFGDSIVWGGYDSQGGWVDRVKRDFISSGAPQKIINLGIGGDTSEFMLERIEHTIKSARISTKEIAIVLSIGVNDSRIIVDGQNPQTNIKEYEANLQSMITIFKKYTDRILVVGLTTTHPDKDSVFAKGFEYRRGLIAEYNEMLRSVSQTNDLEMVDVLAAIDGKPEMFFVDNIHLSDRGHEVLSEVLLPEIKRFVA